MQEHAADVGQRKTNDEDSDQVDPQGIARVAGSPQGVDVDRADDERDLEQGQQLERRDADFDDLRVVVHELVDRLGREEIDDRHHAGQQAALQRGRMPGTFGPSRVARAQCLSDHGRRGKAPGVGRQIGECFDADADDVRRQRRRRPSRRSFREQRPSETERFPPR